MIKALEAAAKMINDQGIAENAAVVVDDRMGLVEDEEEEEDLSDSEDAAVTADVYEELRSRGERRTVWMVRISGSGVSGLF